MALVLPEHSTLSFTLLSELGMQVFPAPQLSIRWSYSVFHRLSFLCISPTFIRDSSVLAFGYLCIEVPNRLHPVAL